MLSHSVRAHRRRTPPSAAALPPPSCCSSAHRPPPLFPNTLPKSHSPRAPEPPPFSTASNSSVASRLVAVPSSTAAQRHAPVSTSFPQTATRAPCPRQPNPSPPPLCPAAACHRLECRRATPPPPSAPQCQAVPRPPPLFTWNPLNTHVPAPVVPILDRPSRRCATPCVSLARTRCLPRLRPLGEDSSSLLIFPSPFLAGRHPSHAPPPIYYLILNQMDIIELG